MSATPAKGLILQQSASAALTTCAVLLGAVVILPNVVASTVGLDSIRMVQAFSLDEGIAVQRMKESLEKFSLDPDSFFYYGNLYHSIAYYCLTSLDRLGWTITTPMAGFVLRLASIMAGLLASVSLWKLGRMLALPSAMAAGVALVLLAMPDFVRYSRTMHPDTLQAFLVIVSLELAILRPTFPFAIMSAMAAGAAFGTKYIGIVVLPFGFLPLAFATLGRERLSHRVLRRLFLQGLAMFGAFVAAFALTNPYAAADRSAFFAVLKWQVNYSSTGYGVVAPTNPALWWAPLVEQFSAVGAVYLLGGFLLACVLLLSDIGRAGWRSAFIRDDLRARLVLILYVLAASAHLAISIHQREARFTYHIIPFLAVLTTLAVWQLTVVLTRCAVSPRWIAAGLAALLLAFASVQVRFDIREMAPNTETPAIKFGDFIAEHYPADTKILADSYAYLPSRMTHVTFSNLQTDELLAKVAPELIVLTHSVSGDYVWKKPGTVFADGDLVRDDRYANAPQFETYLKNLLSPSSGWSVVHEDDTEVLFQRRR